MSLTTTLPSDATKDDERRMIDRIDGYFLDKNNKPSKCTSKRVENMIVFTVQFDSKVKAMIALQETKNNQTCTIVFRNGEEAKVETKKVEKEVVKVETKKVEKEVAKVVKVETKKVEKVVKVNETVENVRKPVSVKKEVVEESIEENNTIKEDTKKTKTFSSLLFVLPNGESLETTKKKLEAYFNRIKANPVSSSVNPHNSNQIFVNFETAEDATRAYDLALAEKNCPLDLSHPSKEKKGKFEKKLKGHPSLKFRLPENMKFETAKKDLEKYFIGLNYKPTGVTRNNNNKSEFFVNFENQEICSKVYELAKKDGKCKFVLNSPIKENKEKPVELIVDQKPTLTMKEKKGKTPFSVGPYNPIVLKTIKENLQKSVEKKYSVQCLFSINFLSFSGTELNCTNAQKNFESDFLCQSLESPNHAMGCTVLLNLIYKVEIWEIFRSVGGEEYSILEKKTEELQKTSPLNHIVEGPNKSKLFFGTCQFYTGVKELISKAKQVATESRGMLFDDEDEMTDLAQSETHSNSSQSETKKTTMVEYNWARDWKEDFVKKKMTLEIEYPELEIKIIDNITNQKTKIQIEISSTDVDLVYKIKKDFLPRNFFFTKEIVTEKLDIKLNLKKNKCHVIFSSGKATIYTLDKSALENVEKEIRSQENTQTESFYKISKGDSYNYISLMIQNIDLTPFIRTVKYDLVKDGIKIKGIPNNVHKAMRFFNDLKTQIQSKTVTFTTNSENHGFLNSEFFSQVLPEHPSIAIIREETKKKKKASLLSSQPGSQPTKTEKSFKIKLKFIGIQMVDIENTEATVLRLISSCVSKNVEIPKDIKNLENIKEKVQQEHQVSLFVPRGLHLFVVSSFNDSSLDSAILDLNDIFKGGKRETKSIKVDNWFVYDHLKVIIEKINSLKLVFCFFQQKSFTLLLKGKKDSVEKASQMIKEGKKKADQEIIREKVSFHEEFYFLLQNKTGIDFVNRINKDNSTLILFNNFSKMCCSLKVKKNQVKLFFGDITDAKCDFIVNSANSKLGNEGGIAHHIIKKAGKLVQDECNEFIKKNHELPLTKTLVTSGGDLKSKIIHVVPPVYSDSDKSCPKNLKLAVINTLNEAISSGAKSIAIPALSCGIFGYPISAGLTIISDATCEFLNNNNINVSFYCNENEMTQQWFEILTESYKATSKNPEFQISNSPTVEYLSEVKNNQQWYFVDADEQWCQYDQINNLKIQQHFENKKHHLSITINMVEYEVNLEKKTQTRKDKGTVRTITNESPTEKIPNWQWAEDNGTWYSYNQANSRALEKALHEKQKSIQFNIQRIVTDIPQTYTCDFKTMIQTSKDGSKRRIKRSDPIENYIKTKIITEENVAETKTIEILGYSKKSISKTIQDLKEYDKSLLCQKIVKGATMRHIDKNTSFYDKLYYKEVKNGLEVTGYAHLVEKSVNSIREIFFDSSMFNTKSYPDNWTGKGDFNLVKLDPKTEEFLAIQRDFNLTTKKKVIRIERVENKHLYDLFSNQKKLQDITNEKFLWHGTRSTPPNDIFQSKTGFDLRYSPGGMWGRGTYFAVNSSYSAGSYFYPVPQTTEKQLFYCCVLVGESKTVMPNDNTLTKPPVKPNGRFVNDSYDSVHGNTGGSDIFIVYELHMGYPQCLLTFE